MLAKCLFLLVTPAGFEPATFSLEDKNHAIGCNGLPLAATPKPLIRRPIIKYLTATPCRHLQPNGCSCTSEVRLSMQAETSQPCKGRRGNATAIDRPFRDRGEGDRQGATGRLLRHQNARPGAARVGQPQGLAFRF